MSSDDVTILTRILVALLIGGAIGLERSFHGRPAGFRTHALVSVSSALLMLVTVYQHQWMTGFSDETVRTDPTRMAQGIMTGIGFLGAGVIFKEGLSVRGLTTAASIWTTASIGVLVGIGFFVPAALGTLATLLILSAFRLIERRLPSEFFAHHTLRFARDAALSEEELRALVGTHGFTVASLSHRLADGGRAFEYQMVLRNRDRQAAERLSRQLRGLPEVIGFRIVPASD